MAKMKWDQTTEKTYETGVQEVALFPIGSDGSSENGVPWNGITNVTESPSGAEETPLYANNRKYMSMISAEELGGSIEAYTYPDEWEECDGSKEIAEGVSVGQQIRKPFNLVYKTLKGNDSEGNDHGYKLHLLYNATASVSERAYNTVNDSPEAITFNWEFKSTPVDIGEGFKPASLITIDSTKVNSAKLKTLLDKVYGTESAEPSMPTAAEVYSMFKTA